MHGPARRLAQSKRGEKELASDWTFQSAGLRPKRIALREVLRVSRSRTHIVVDCGALGRCTTPIKLGKAASDSSWRKSVPRSILLSICTPVPCCLSETAPPRPPRVSGVLGGQMFKIRGTYHFCRRPCWTSRVATYRKAIQAPFRWRNAGLLRKLSRCEIDG